MTEITQEDLLALRKFGLHVPQNQREEVFKQIRSTPSLKEEFQKINLSIKTMQDENEFLDAITNSHNKIAQIPQNQKVIQLRDSTFVIRAINPEQIESLTERAFFNSFSLERIMRKDVQYDFPPEETKKVAENIKEQKVHNPTNVQNVSREEFQNIQKEENYDSEKANCICGKFKEKEVQWIQCANQGKCRGSSWYHLQCSGLGDVPPEELQSLNFICSLCKRNVDQSSDGNKRVKKN